MHGTSSVDVVNSCVVYVLVVDNRNIRCIQCVYKSDTEVCDQGVHNTHTPLRHFPPTPIYYLKWEIKVLFFFWGGIYLMFWVS